MNRFFKRRKVRVSIIPHASEDAKHSKFLFVFIPVFFLLLFSLMIYLLVISAMNFKNISKYASVRKTKEEVKLLSIKDNELKEKIGEIDKGVKNLKSDVKAIMPVFEFMSGIKKTESEIIKLPRNLDSLIMLTKSMRSSIDSALSILSRDKRNLSVPSIVPVSGWILRKFGKVIDPFTQTERISVGILFVSETIEKVFSSADGEVIHAGIKDKSGSTIIIKHAQGYKTQYSHLSNIIVSVGDNVKKGQHIGYAGKTGKTLSSSLFYKITRNDSLIDPESSFQIPTYFLYDTLIINL